MPVPTRNEREENSNQNTKAGEYLESLVTEGKTEQGTELTDTQKARLTETAEYLKQKK